MRSQDATWAEPGRGVSIIHGNSCERLGRNRLGLPSQQSVWRTFVMYAQPFFSPYLWETIYSGEGVPERQGINYSSWHCNIKHIVVTGFTSQKLKYLSNP